MALMAQEFRERVGKAIRGRRKEIGMGPMAFAQEMHVNVKTTERWERGETDGALRVLDQIAVALKTDVLTLTCWPDEQEDQPREDVLASLNGNSVASANAEQIVSELKAALVPLERKLAAIEKRLSAVQDQQSTIVRDVRERRAQGQKQGPQARGAKKAGDN